MTQEFTDRPVNFESFVFLAPDKKIVSSKPGLLIFAMYSILTEVHGPLGIEFHELGPF